MTMEMTPEEIGAFLDEWPFIAVATLRRDGSPFVQPLGHSLHERPVHLGDDLHISIANGRTIISRLRRDPRISITAFNQKFPTRWVIIEGRAEEVDDPGNELSRYILHYSMRGVDVIDLAEFERNWLAAGRTVFRIRIDQLRSFDSYKKKDYNAEAGITLTEMKRQTAPLPPVVG